MSTLDMEYDQVLQQLRATRSIIAPNKGAWVGVTIYRATTGVCGGFMTVVGVWVQASSCSSERSTRHLTLSTMPTNSSCAAVLLHTSAAPKANNRQSAAGPNRWLGAPRNPTRHFAPQAMELSLALAVA